MDSELHRRWLSITFWMVVNYLDDGRDFRVTLRVVVNYFLNGGELHCRW